MGGHIVSDAAPPSLYRFRRPPSTLGRADFMATFGGVYEHSPWIAEQVFDNGLSSACDTAEGLHAAMARIVDDADDEARCRLLRAHPDLAGRLAVAGELTDASSAEQASAGLDQCTRQEFERFQTLNAAYKAKFEIPFILAVRGKTRGDILRAFERRVVQSVKAEFAEALRQVHQIALLRLRRID